MQAIKMLTLLISFCCVTLMNSTLANATPASKIPVESFFKNRDILSAHLSPTGEYLAVIADTDKEAKVYIFTTKDMKPHTAPFEWNSSRFKGKTEIGRFIWINDDRFIASLMVKMGAFDRPMLTGEYFSSNADGSRKADLSLLKQAAWGHTRPFYIIDLLNDDKKHILIQDSSTGAYPTAYRLNVYNGKRKKVARSPAHFGSMHTASNGDVLLASGVTNDDEQQVYYRKTKSDDWQQIAKFDSKDGGMEVIGFSPDDKGIYVYLPKGKQGDHGLYLYDLASKKTSLISRRDANIDESIIWGAGDKKDLPVGFRSHPGYPVNEFINNQSSSAQLYASLQSFFPDNDIVISNYTDDGKKALVRVRNDKNSGSYYLFDTKKSKIINLFTSRPWLDEKHLVEVKPVKFTARDGVEINGYLTLPQGASKDLPLVLNIHGGPYGVRDYWGFNSENQFLANRGYAVLQVNYRGSSGYGRDFQYGAYKQVGAEMQDDITDATLWAIKQGIADKKRICIYGASYGGYAALMAVVKEPELYQCAIPYVGVYDITLMKHSDIVESRSGINFLKSAWGYDDEQFLFDRSPINFLDKLKASLFFVHGEKDRRVPIEQYEAVTEKLDEMAYPYESYVEAKEAHGFAKFENRVKLYKKIELFLDKHIGETGTK
jgi:dipeptidyl aminopeptidase/acylaminoacyl peptidase